MTEGKGFCRRRQENRAQTQLKKDLENIEKIVVFANMDKRKRKA